MTGAGAGFGATTGAGFAGLIGAGCVTPGAGVAGTDGTGLKFSSSGSGIPSAAAKVAATKKPMHAVVAATIRNVIPNTPPLDLRARSR
jgi:hypothetical protein